MRSYPFMPAVRRFAVAVATHACAWFAIAQSPTADSFDPGANGDVTCVAVQPDGKILLGGTFSMLCGQARANLGRVHADGMLDTDFDPGVNGLGVSSLAIQPDGKILVGGSFTMVGGESRTNLARLNPDGTLDTAFKAWANGRVFAVALQEDGKTIVAGEFTMLAEQLGRTCIGRLHPDGTLDREFNVRVEGFYPGIGSVVIQPDGKVLIGGRFDTLDDQPRANLGRLMPYGAIDAPFQAWAYYPPRLALQADGRIMVSNPDPPMVTRLKSDGNTELVYPVGISGSLAVLTDGRLLVHTYRFQPDGTWDRASTRG